MITISQTTARRFVLGKQGLWPGRRWKGRKGTAQAIRECEAVQLDPLNIFARSQDIVLHSRVLDYKPEYLYKIAYKEREFFDYGGWLAMYPMTNLPYYRVHMERRKHHKRVEDFVLSNPELFEQVRRELRTRGPLGNRNFNGNAVSGNYRGRKDTSLALFDMWLCGELMIHHREGFERVYDFRENIAPREYDYIADEKAAEDFFFRQNISFNGLFREAVLKPALQYDMQRNYSRADVSQLIGSWLKSGRANQVKIEGGRDTYLVLAEDVPALELSREGKSSQKPGNRKIQPRWKRLPFFHRWILSAHGDGQRSCLTLNTNGKCIRLHTCAAGDTMCCRSCTAMIWWRGST